MNIKLKTSYLNYFRKQPDEQGFSWIKLLVLLLLLGIAAAVTLPVLVNELNRRKEAEGKAYVGSMNRAQQAYYLETGTFTISLKKLGIGIEPETENYSYQIAPGIPIGQNRYRFVFPSSTNQPLQNYFEKLNKHSNSFVAMNVATPKKPELKTYVGLAWNIGLLNANAGKIVLVCELTTATVLWESEKPSIPPPDTVTFSSSSQIDICMGGLKTPAILPPKGFREVLR